VQVSTITTASKVIGGLYYFCSLLSTKSIDCWGQNSDGQLGNGTTVGSDVPVSVTGITDAKSVMSGSESDTNCAVLSTTAVDCWGYNAYGQLGDGTTTNSDVPVSTGVTHAKRLAVDLATEGTAVGFCALLTTGHVECWGYNAYGELGNGTTTESNVPVKVKKIKTASSIVGGDDGYCALLSSHSIDCWGRGDNGELGNGTMTSSDVPVAVETITNGSKVVSGYLNYCAVLTTKKLDCWGYNGAGQLGDGTMTGSDTPVAVEAP
jgi:alpha-tubulin suppressor-like RCC1 family protein